jgi:hypothetical protein
VLKALALKLMVVLMVELSLLLPVACHGCRGLPPDSLR